MALNNNHSIMETQAIQEIVNEEELPVEVQDTINSEHSFSNTKAASNEGLGLWLWCFQQYFSYFVPVSFIGGGNRSTRRKSATYRKSQAKFIT